MNPSEEGCLLSAKKRRGIRPAKHISATEDATT